MRCDDAESASKRQRGKGSAPSHPLKGGKLVELRRAQASNANLAEGLEERHLAAAALDRVRAARVEGAAGRRVERRRKLALYAEALPPRLPSSEGVLASSARV